MLSYNEPIIETHILDDIGLFVKNGNLMANKYMCLTTGPYILRKNVIRVAIGRGYIYFIDNNNNLYSLDKKMIEFGCNDKAILIAKAVVEVKCTWDYVAYIVNKPIKNMIILDKLSTESINKPVRSVSGGCQDLCYVTEDNVLYNFGITRHSTWIANNVDYAAYFGIKIYYLSEKNIYCYSREPTIQCKQLISDVDGMRIVNYRLYYIKDRICYMLTEKESKQTDINGVLINWSPDCHKLVLQPPHNRIFTFLLCCKIYKQYISRLVQHIVISYIVF